MRKYEIILIPLLILLSINTKSFPQSGMKHYIFFNVYRDRIHESSFLNTKQIEGAQLKYTWPELEPEKGNYNFDLIQNDLDFLTAHGKKLFIQVQDVSFDTSIVNIPGYILKDTIYHGGAAIQYEFNEEKKEYTVEGLVARRWDKNVAERFHLLLTELGKRFDGKIAGINLPETDIGFGSEEMYPEGYTDEKYRDAVKETMRALKNAFPNSVGIQYANFMHGEWLPYDDKGYLKSLFDYAKEIKLGMGGPDIKVYRKAQMNHSYKFIRECKGIIPTGVAVQWGNYDLINPKTNEQVTVPEIYKFGKDYLKLDYIFWSTQEPYYSESLLPFLSGLKE